MARSLYIFTRSRMVGIGGRRCVAAAKAFLIDAAGAVAIPLAKVTKTKTRLSETETKVGISSR